MSIFPTRILLATDGSEDAELAATTAGGLARTTPSELYVVHTWREVQSVHFDALIRREMEREAQGILDEQVRKIEGLGGTVAQARLSEGDAAEEIIAAKTAGIRHVTTIAGEPRRKLDFYDGVLGLKLVKKTANPPKSALC